MSFVRFVACPLPSHVFPTQPSDSDSEMPLPIIKKPRKILKARRLIKKPTPAITDRKQSSDKLQVPIPKAFKTPVEAPQGRSVAFRAIENAQSGKKYRKSSTRRSDASFLENEKLCGTDADTEAVLNLNVNKPSTLSKRKSSQTTEKSSKKRRTLDRTESTSIKALRINSSSHKPFKPKAMPNFAKLFKLQLENTENIVEYKQRKAERAANLLSGVKPIAKSTPNRITSPTMKRELTFTAADSPNLAKLPKLPKERLKSTEKSVKIPLKTHQLSASTSVIYKKKLNDLRSTYAKSKPTASSTPNISSTIPVAFITKNFIKSQDKDFNGKINLGSCSKFELNSTNVTVRSKIPQIQTVPEPKNTAKIELPETSEKPRENKTIIGIVKPNRLKKEEIVKVVQTRARPDREMADTRRHEIKGVRLNRRFELLMQMRNKN